MANVTQILSQIEKGDSTAAEQLLPLVYDELRRLAKSKLTREKPGQTLQATALVHEAYLRLLGPDGVQQQQWSGRGHFFAAAAEAMRRILVEKARQKLGPKRGGTMRRVPLDQSVESPDIKADQILNVNEALEKLAKESSVKADLVKLRFFAGFGHQEAAEALGLSRATADRYWAYAKAFLYAALNEENSDEIS